MTAANYRSMDEALEILAIYGPDLSNGLTSHAPMAVEALCALGRPDAAIPWIEQYRAGLLPKPVAHQRISPDDWRTALGQGHRFGDWSAFFTQALREAPWRVVLNQWTGRLAPGICASAAHGVIRVGHAARSLGESESPHRLAELADALASWAYAYQELPTSSAMATRPLRPRDAIAKVPVMQPKRSFFNIVSALEALNDFPDFAPVIGLLDVSVDPNQLIAELTDVFARIYLANTHDVLTSIVFVHGVTSIAALANILPYLDEATVRAGLRFAWQASCGLYAAFGTRPLPADHIDAPREDSDTLIDMAIRHGDEHAIKFTEACLRFHALNPSPAYLAAARNALEMLPPGVVRAPI